jgi:hypothetical protein
MHMCDDMMDPEGHLRWWSACNDVGMVGWIFMKFVLDVMSFEANSESYLLISYNQ